MNRERDLSQTSGKLEQMRAFAGWMMLLCQALEASVVVFMRSNFGRRYFGVQAAAVIPIILVYSLFWEGHDTTPLLWYLGLYLLAWGIARTRIIRRSVTDDTEHSFYSGTPSVLRWKLFKGRLSERKAKALVEPLLLFLLGMGLTELNKPLGTYVLLAASGLVMSIQMARAYDRTRVMDMRDAHIEQRHFAERFREGGWR